MRKITIALFALCLVLTLTLPSCKTPPAEAKPTLKEKVQGATYILGTVTQNGANKNSDFTGFFLRFNAEGTQVTIKTGGTNSTEFTSNCSFGESSVNISTPPANTGWTVLSSATTRDDNKPTSGLKFDVAIINPKTGSATFNFDLNKQ